MKLESVHSEPWSVVKLSVVPCVAIATSSASMPMLHIRLGRMPATDDDALLLQHVAQHSVAPERPMQAQLGPRVRLDLRWDQSSFVLRGGKPCE
jgi:hypothetical protein